MPAKTSLVAQRSLTHERRAVHGYRIFFSVTPYEYKRIFRISFSDDSGE
jgi:hypothetical protein